MASVVQSRTGGADGRNITATAALSSTATRGNILVSGVGVDKNSTTRPAPSTGWTPVDADNNASISSALAWREADGTILDQCVWTWTNGMPEVWWIAETDITGTPNIVFASNFSDGTTAIASVALPRSGTITARGAGMAFAMVAIDTGSNWTTGGRTGRWTGSLTVEQLNPATPAPDTQLTVSWATVADAAAVSTTATSNSGGRDQASGILVLIGQASGAQTAELDVARETDGAPDLATTTAITVGLDAATETDSSPSLTIATSVTASLDAATETDSALDLTTIPGVVTATLDAATETDTAPDIAAEPGAISAALDAATETDSAPDLTTEPGIVYAALDAARETDRAPDLIDPGRPDVSAGELALLGVG